MGVLFFFFSSRRRHTRSLRDWSSDVCSSDLGETFERGQIGHRQAAGGHDTKLGAARGPSACLDTPMPAAGLEPRRGHARVKLDVAPQIKAIGNVSGIAQKLRLGRVALAPVPLL